MHIVFMACYVHKYESHAGLLKALFTTTFSHHDLLGVCLGLLLLRLVHIQFLSLLEQFVVSPRLGKHNKAAAIFAVYIVCHCYIAMP